MEYRDFAALPAIERVPLLLSAIGEAHNYHFERNAAYRRTVRARGGRAEFDTAQLALLLRPASLTFKGYVEQVGAFPQDDPPGFMSWLDEQLSLPLPKDRRGRFRRSYRSLEAFLLAIEHVYADFGLEIVTSTGTSGRPSMVVRDAATVEMAVSAFFTGIRRTWAIQRGTALIFVMPSETRVAMARIARFGTRQLDWAAQSPIYYTLPFSTTPDQIRIRTGRTFRTGWRGFFERRLLHPFMEWANSRVAMPRTVAETRARLAECVAKGTPLMLLGGLVQLHAVACAGNLALPPGSRVATGGGQKEQSGLAPGDMRDRLRAAFAGAPVTDVYGMAEANWAAFECAHGNHHLPPWILAVVTDDNDHLISGPDAIGLLAFYDPVGGGDLLPPFFQTADRVRLVNGGTAYHPDLVCPCGEDTPYLKGAIERVDLLEEAGCAAQV